MEQQRWHENQERRLEHSVKTRWNTFKYLDEDYIQKRLGTTVCDGKDINDEKQKARGIQPMCHNVCNLRPI